MIIDVLAKKIQIQISCNKRGIGRAKTIPTLTLKPLAPRVSSGNYRSVRHSTAAAKVNVVFLVCTRRPVPNLT